MISLKFLKYIKRRNVPTFPIQFAQFCEEKVESDKTKSVDSNEKEENVTKKVDSAAVKLNKLLTSMKAVEDTMLLKSVDLPRAGGREKKKNRLEKMKTEDKSKDIVQAAKDVAALLSEDKKKIESELLSKLMNHTTVTDALASNSDENKSNDLRNIINGMKIDNSGKNRTRAEYVRETIFEEKRKHFSDEGEQKIRSSRNQRLIAGDVQSVSESVNLFGQEPLKIFTKDDKSQEAHDCLKTWQILEMKANKSAVTHPPANYFEKMALWTEQGKLWRFPINNEQGLEDQEKVDFSEHIFLEQHLESWCPRKGPIRHFMELVCVGLSKNPYITANEKKEHILWYENYFKEKNDILKEVIQQADKSEQKQLEN